MLAVPMQGKNKILSTSANSPLGIPSEVQHILKRNSINPHGSSNTLQHSNTFNGGNQGSNSLMSQSANTSTNYITVSGNTS